MIFVPNSLFYRKRILLGLRIVSFCSKPKRQGLLLPRLMAPGCPPRSVSLLQVLNSSQNTCCSGYLVTGLCSYCVSHDRLSVIQGARSSSPHPPAPCSASPAPSPAPPHLTPPTPHPPCSSPHAPRSWNTLLLVHPAPHPAPLHSRLIIIIISLHQGSTFA